MTVDEPTVAPPRRSTVLVLAAVALVALCWIVGNPRSAGPDEPSHMIAGAGFVRLQGSGDANDGITRLMDVPDMVGSPDPTCWAFQPTETPACTDDIEPSDDVVVRATTSYNYPVWGLILPGVASFVPWPGGYAYLARLLSAAIPVLLVGVGLAHLAARQRLLGAAALLGITPIAWFTFGTVNPSAVAIAGGFALCAGLLLLDQHRRPNLDLLVVAGWLAVLLPRRDGPLWATLVVIGACAVLDRRPSELWRGLRDPLRWATVAAIAIPIVQVVWRRDLGFNLLLAAAPIGLVAVDTFMARWRRTVDRTGRMWLLAAAAAAAVLAAGFVVLRRPGGYDADVVRLVVANTGDHLVQLVGILGWLDAPVPTSAVLLYWVALGAVAGVALLYRPRSAATAAGMLGCAVVVAWMLELGQGSNYGDYWQGRYSMPLAIALPLLAAWGVRERRTEVVVVPIVVVSWLVSNLAFFAAQRRWAVGNDGTWFFWRWGTWEAPVHPALMLVVHAAASAWLAVVVVGRRPAVPE
jgi:hypothetical protein